MHNDSEALKKLQAQKLSSFFYLNDDVVSVARNLLGKVLVSYFNDQLTAGRIVETEAYNGPVDKAAHSYNNRRTSRTETMYNAGGVTYLYLCYGLHHMFNVVTGAQGVPTAVLVRALEPLFGTDTMLQRSNKKMVGFDLTRGPGNVGKVLGLHKSQSGLSLQSDQLFIADDGVIYNDADIAVTKRIGVDYAAEDALLPYRFLVKGNKYVSGKLL